MVKEVVCIVKGLNGKILLSSLVAVSMMASGLWGSAGKPKERIAPILVTREVLAEYVEDRLSQLEKKENLTQEQALELGFIRDNRDNPHKLAEFYGMEIKDAGRNRALARAQPSARGTGKKPLREISQSYPISSNALEVRKAEETIAAKDRNSDEEASGSVEISSSSVESEIVITARKTLRQPSPLNHRVERTEITNKHNTRSDLKDKSISIVHPLIAPNLSAEEEQQIVRSEPRAHIATEEEAREFFANYRKRQSLNSSIEEGAQTVQRRSPPLAITEEEVRQFLANYRERYSHKDISGFLSLFSSSALQNGRHGFNEIRRIYSDFFDQSAELRYRLENPRIDIYQEALISDVFFKNVAVVEAVYEVAQTSKKKGDDKVWRGGVHWVLIREKNGALKIRYLNYRQEKPSYRQKRRSMRGGTGNFTTDVNR